MFKIIKGDDNNCRFCLEKKSSIPEHDKNELLSFTSWLILLFILQYLE